MSMNNTATATASTSSPSPLSMEWWEPQPAPASLPQADATRALEGLRRLHASALPVLRLPEQTDDLPEIQALADTIAAQSDTVVLVGIGGSSLGAEALSALSPIGHKLSVEVMDNPDPDTFADFKARLNPARTSWLFVSKSGGTLETVSQVLIVLAWLEQTIGKAEIAARCSIVTEPKESSMTKLAAHYGIPTFVHDPDLGGRWSCVSNIGLVPAACAGVNIKELRAGMAAMLHHTLSAPVEANQPLQGAIYGVRHASAGRSIHAIMPYVDRLEFTAAWCRQLISESLGKGGKGITPLASLGTVDQHSMLQLMLDGPDDKYFTVISTDQRGKGEVIPQALADVCGLGYLGGQPLGNVLDAFQQGTVGSMQASRRPVRTIHIPAADAYHTGALLMYFMLETILIAQLIGVDAFDQPAVEDSKVRAKHVLNPKA